MSARKITEKTSFKYSYNESLLNLSPTECCKPARDVLGRKCFVVIECDTVEKKEAMHAALNP